MPTIPVTVHSVLDYLVGAALILLPLLLGLPSNAATTTLQVVGVATIIVSLITAYRLSVLKLVPYRLHLVLDAAMGVLMLIVAAMTYAGDLASMLLIGAGIIYIAVPLLSWPLAAAATAP